ncbi:bifunctional RNase H/acid phosphatase [Legionella lansingensis]|uniref:Bifunctional RNase H/acid phosphatase n=1 Tax=Legionella lansingensis TaxID=45067 RepID=A0A0W0VF69_9GAMM|nr:histidine phosphatase family protein [Legionella lansingensis]KTD18782.1 bifunctional RNase H/acid phosphatase [Legionella lansingensis]SNV58810.1 bifunctional RNase H/acid phosphatase [Legionella lansingensis]
MVDNCCSSLIQNNEFFINLLADLGILVDKITGHLYYMKSFKPLKLCVEVIFVRHGETYGNCGQVTADGTIDREMVNADIINQEHRVFQGSADTEINQLTKRGEEQALSLAQKLNEICIDNWKPDVILASPSTRAIKTALPFIQLWDYSVLPLIYKGVREISFGTWENKRLCDFHRSHSCYLFSQHQHALIKAESIAQYPNAENFAELIFRAYSVLHELNTTFTKKRVIIFSHTLFGAACLIVLGKGQYYEGHEYLAFDGRRKDGSYYTMPNAEPVKFWD